MLTYGTKSVSRADGTVIIKQTIYKNGRYRVCLKDGKELEVAISPGPHQNQLIGQAILEAHKGQLCSHP